jgi:hypothetical protein
VWIGESRSGVGASELHEDTRKRDRVALGILFFQDDLVNRSPDRIASIEPLIWGEGSN